MAQSKTRTFGILTSGGDCPGLNAAIRGVARAATNEYGMNVIGISNGYRGLIDGDAKLLKSNDFSGILTQGGTILGASREKPFKFSMKDSEAGRNKVDEIKENYRKLGLDCLVVLGGNGTQRTAHLLQEEGLNVIGLPKTIDNDIWGTDITFGYYSAMSIATQAIDRLHTTALSHNRVMIVEIMGHKAGWLALSSGLAGGADVICIPEIPYDPRSITSYLMNRASAGKEFSIIAVAEGAMTKDEAKLTKEERKKKLKKNRHLSRGMILAQEIEETIDMECRVTVLGYQQRGGAPSPMDRVLSTRFGIEGAKLLAEGQYGRMVCMKGDTVSSIPLSEVAGKLKTVPPDHNLVESARMVQTCFGDT
ncbi:MAG: 6-phosphofructokinase [Planctomycetes bacterium]|nr:6-phosphofructokinase [Planctomycetota bacterium]